MSRQPISKFSGSLVAIVTPMNGAGAIDYPRFAELIEWHIKQGTDGIVALGTTGEGSLLEEEEFLEASNFVVNQVRQRVPVILGCAAISTAKGVKLAKQLDRYQADALLCVTPYYVKPTQDGLKAYYLALAEACQTPLILYNVPGRTGVDLANETILSLAEHPNIVGLKDATGDLSRVQALFETKKTFSWLSGDDATAFDYIQKGGDGVISVTANIVPRQMHLWIEGLLQLRSKDCHEPDLTLFRELFESIAPLNHMLFIESNPIPTKWALWKMNKLNPGIRLPLTWLSETNQQQIEKTLCQCKVLTSAE